MFDGIAKLVSGHKIPIGDWLASIVPDYEPPADSLLTKALAWSRVTSLLGAAIDGGDRTPTWLLLGVRREEDILYGDELGALAAAHPQVRLVTTLSHLDARNDGTDTFGDGNLATLVCTTVRATRTTAMMPHRTLERPRTQMRQQKKS